MKGFQKGKSGNPSGRPKGIADKRVTLRAAFAEHKDALIAQAISMALAGDAGAMRLCLERLVPAIRPTSEPVTLRIPKSGTMTDYGKTILAAIAHGKLAPDTGGQLLQALGAQAKIIETDDLLRRIEILENART